MDIIDSTAGDSGGDCEGDDSGGGSRSNSSGNSINNSTSTSNTTGNKSKSMNATKDAHTRQRLSLMVASLQNAARYVCRCICTCVDVKMCGILSFIDSCMFGCRILYLVCDRYQVGGFLLSLSLIFCGTILCAIIFSLVDPCCSVSHRNWISRPVTSSLP